MGWRLVYQSGNKVQNNFSLRSVEDFRWNISARYADDAGHRKFTDEVYEHQYRLIAGAQWQPKAIGWTDFVIYSPQKQNSCLN